MFRILTVVLAGLFLTAASPSFAQTKETARSPQAGAPSARQLALSRRYVELIQGEALEDMIREMITASARNDATMRGASEEDRQFLIDLATEVTTDVMPQMMDQLVPIYARTFSEEELEALVAFYDSEIGRSIILKTMTSMPEANEAMMSVLPGMLDKMVNRMCARYGCDPDDYRDEIFGATGIDPPVRDRSYAK